MNDIHTVRFFSFKLKPSQQQMTFLLSSSEVSDKFYTFHKLAEIKKLKSGLIESRSETESEPGNVTSIY